MKAVDEFKRDYPDLYNAVRSEVESELQPQGGHNRNQGDHVDEITLKRRWEQDPALRSEFMQDFESFCAFEKAKADGRVHIAKKAQINS